MGASPPLRASKHYQPVSRFAPVVKPRGSLTQGYGSRVRLSLQPSLNRGDYTFSYQLRARFAETDAMQVVHHSRYLPWLEAARVEYLRHVGRPYADLRTEGLDLTVLEAHVQYRQPVRFDELVDIHLVLGEVTRTTFQIGYLLTVDGETRATGVTVHGCVNSEGRPQRLPSWLLTLAPR